MSRSLISMTQLTAKNIVMWVIFFILLIFFILHVLIPAPPKKLVMVTGNVSGAYYPIGLMFKDELAQYGIELEVRATQGSDENLKLLSAKGGAVDLALMQSGTGTAKDHPELESYASLFYEPFWIVFNPASFQELGREPNTIAELKNKKISIGTQGSGSYRLSQAVLKLSDLNTSRSDFVELATEDSYAALKEGRLDAMMFVLAPDSALAQKILNDSALTLMSIEQAYGYPGRLPYLKPITLKPGVLSIVKDIPHSQKLTIAPVAELVAKKDLNPAIVYLLMSISKKYFSKPGLISAENEFPANAGLSFSLNEDAENYLRSGPSFLFQYLPFWVAVWVERMLKLSLPLLALLIPLFNLIPSLTEYRKKLKFANIYRDLKIIEQSLNDQTNRERLFKQISDIDLRAKELNVSDFHTKDIYELRMHIESARNRLIHSG